MSNFRNVLKVFTMMRDFEPDDHALLNTLRGVTEAEREMLVEALGPVKRTTAKRTRKSNKSPRAAPLGDTIRNNLQRRAPAIGGFADDTNMIALCSYVFAKDSAVNAGMKCGEPAANMVHDKAAGYAGYHPFQPAAAQAAAGGE